jgi:hypothetical protein
MKIDRTIAIPTWATGSLIRQAVIAAASAGLSAFLRVSATHGIMAVLAWPPPDEQHDEEGKDRRLFQLLFSEQLDRREPTWLLYTLRTDHAVPHFFNAAGQEASTPWEFRDRAYVRLTSRKSGVPRNHQRITRARCAICETEIWAPQGFVLCISCAASGRIMV